MWMWFECLAFNWTIRNWNTVNDNVNDNVNVTFNWTIRNWNASGKNITNAVEYLLIEP